MNTKSRRRPRPSSLLWCISAVLAGCNLLAGIEEGKLALCPDGTRLDEGTCGAGGEGTIGGSTCTSCVCTAPFQYGDPATGHCYYVESNEEGWKTARQACLAAGGDLATVGSQAELAFLASTVHAEVWIGGTDLLTEGLFVWANGEPFEFAPWISGSPDDSGGKEDCVVLQDASAGEEGFDDRSCGDKYAYLCERKPTAP